MDGYMHRTGQDQALGTRHQGQGRQKGTEIDRYRQVGMQTHMHTYIGIHTGTATRRHTDNWTPTRTNK